MALASNALRDGICVVAGATRGAGRGIAAELGAAGATVICTGRSSRNAGHPRSDYDRRETIEETAELVTALGGVGVPEIVDHLEPAQVAALAERIRKNYGRIDVLGTTSGARRNSRAGRRIGTSRCGRSISRRGCASCGSGSRRIW